MTTPSKEQRRIGYVYIAHGVAFVCVGVYCITLGMAGIGALLIAVGLWGIGTLLATRSLWR
jgi:hypothetical protein